MGRSKISEFSDAEIQEELKRREEAKKPKRPAPLRDIDWHALVSYLERSLDSVEQEGYVDDDFKHYVFEYVMTTVYGNNVWKWWNNF